MMGGKGKQPAGKSNSEPLKAGRRKSISSGTAADILNFLRPSSSLGSVSDMATPSSSSDTTPRGISSKKTPIEYPTSHMVDMGNFANETPGVLSHYALELLSEEIPKEILPFASSFKKGFYVYITADKEVCVTVIHNTKLVENLNLTKCISTEEQKNLIDIDNIKTIFFNSSDVESLQNLKNFIAQCCEHKTFANVNAHYEAKARKIVDEMRKKILQEENINDEFTCYKGKEKEALDSLKTLAAIMNIQQNRQAASDKAKEYLKKIGLGASDYVKDLEIKTRTQIYNLIIELDKTKLLLNQAENHLKIKGKAAKIEGILGQLKRIFDEDTKIYPLLSKVFWIIQEAMTKQIAMKMKEVDEGHVSIFSDLAFVQGKFTSTKHSPQVIDERGNVMASNLEFTGTVSFLWKGTVAVQSFTILRKNDTDTLHGKDSPLSPQRTSTGKQNGVDLQKDEKKQKRSFLGLRF